VLIYLEPEAQERLLERFHFALRPGGRLWLGSAEIIGRRTDLF
jgi:two-component system, chemotaxis family, CheB/CheR fusion protein